MISVISLANTIIKLGSQENISITPMKLQKLIYFIYKEYFKKYKTPLFSDRFEAWQYGPVVRCVYDEFKHFGSRSINEYAKDAVGNIYVIKLDENSRLIKEVWDKYKYYDGIKLSAMTHQPNTAWDKAVRNYSGILSDEDIENEPTSN